MYISYEPLPSSKDGFRDGLQWYEEIEAWSRKYEEEFMVPDSSNKTTADKVSISRYVSKNYINVTCRPLPYC